MTSNKTLLARTGEWQTSRTGKFQTTGFENVDNAFATLISNIFSDILLVAPAPEEKRFASFLNRPPAERVYVARFDNAIEFLKAVRRANAGQGENLKTRTLTGMLSPGQYLTHYGYQLYQR